MTLSVEWMQENNYNVSNFLRGDLDPLESSLINAPGVPVDGRLALQSSLSVASSADPINSRQSVVGF